MKISNTNQLNDFISAVNTCKGAVRLTTPEGEEFDLKQTISRYIGLGKLLSDRGEYMELFCDRKDDEKNFFRFFRLHPEMQI